MRIMTTKIYLEYFKDIYLFYYIENTSLPVNQKLDIIIKLIS